MDTQDVLENTELYMCICICTCGCVHTCVCTCVCTYVCMYVHLLVQTKHIYNQYYIWSYKLLHIMQLNKEMKT